MLPEMPPESSTTTLGYDASPSLTLGGETYTGPTYEGTPFAHIAHKKWQAFVARWVIGFPGSPKLRDLIATSVWTTDLVDSESEPCAAEGKWGKYSNLMTDLFHALTLDPRNPVLRNCIHPPNESELEPVQQQRFGTLQDTLRGLAREYIQGIMSMDMLSKYKELGTYENWYQIMSNVSNLAMLYLYRMYYTHPQYFDLDNRPILDKLVTAICGFYPSHILEDQITDRKADKIAGDPNALNGLPPDQVEALINRSFADSDRAYETLLENGDKDIYFDWIRINFFRNVVYPLIAAKEGELFDSQAISVFTREWKMWLKWTFKGMVMQWTPKQ